MNLKEQIKKFWNFLKEDTWQSWLVSLILLIVIIKFIFFPLMSLLTGTPLPLVVVESCSMYHESDFNTWWNSNAGWYEARNITKEQFKSFSLKYGFNKGDILFVTGRGTPHIGNVIIFKAESKYPIIHRVISLSPLETKGDHNSGQLTMASYGVDETNIDKNGIVGYARFKVVPLLGWVKLIFFEPLKPANERGFCR